MAVVSTFRCCTTAHCVTRSPAPRYWETGEEDNAFRYNNYLGRFHWRHIDVMDVLSGYQSRARASLSDTAVLLGFPGKLGFDGSQVWDAYLRGEITRIRQYCETDVINTWLVYLRFQHMRGRLTDAGTRGGAGAHARLAHRSTTAAFRRVPRCME